MRSKRSKITKEYNSRSIGLPTHVVLHAILGYLSSTVKLLLGNSTLRFSRGHQIRCKGKYRIMPVTRRKIGKACTTLAPMFEF